MMRHEAEDEAEIAHVEFKANVFANDPKLYYELFEKERIGDEEHFDPDDVVFPETPEEFRSMISSMKREGVIGG